LKIPLNPHLKNGKIKMKNFFNFPSPFDGRGIRERVKECKRRLECNNPLSLTLSHAGERGKNKSHYFPFFYFPSFLKMGDFIYVKKQSKKIYFIFYKNLLSLMDYIL